MLVFDASDVYLREGGATVPVIKSGNWWVAQGFGTATRLYSGLPLAYLPFSADGHPLPVDSAGRQIVSRDDGRPREESGQGWFLYTRTPQGRVWEPYSLSGPLGAAITRKVEQEPGWAVTRGYYWLCGPGLGDSREGYVTDTVIAVNEADRLDGVPLTFSGLRSWLLKEHPRVYGVLWTHKDGRMARVLRSDMATYLGRNS